MAVVTLEKGSNPDCPPQGQVGVFACDDGTVQIVMERDGEKMVCTLSPDEFDFQVAVGGIRMGMIARAAAAQRKITLADVVVPPDIQKQLVLAHGFSNGKLRG